MVVVSNNSILLVVVFKNRGGKTLTAINSGCKTTIKVHQKKIKCRRHKVFSDVTTYLLVVFVTFMFFCSWILCPS